MDDLGLPGFFLCAKAARIRIFILDLERGHHPGYTSEQFFHSGFVCWFMNRPVDVKGSVHVKSGLWVMEGCVNGTIEYVKQSDPTQGLFHGSIASQLERKPFSSDFWNNRINWRSIFMQKT